MSILYIIVSVACFAVGGYLILAQLNLLGKERQETDPEIDIKGLVIGGIFVVVGILLIAI
jgi:hypothetical protein